ncbi:MAG: peptide chain release factor-like protein [Deltaproteobacteria bacterium]|nr:peptide chain release factor-like protein [Deltaproteobacteria bacterium]
MARLGIHEADLKEQFVRGSGAGGQKINKTSSTVILLHRPSGIRVRCQESRSQAQNRILARRLLVQKIGEQIQGIENRNRSACEKIRRQKRKRSKRGKEQMLRGKKHRSERLAQRQLPEE